MKVHMASGGLTVPHGRRWARRILAAVLALALLVIASSREQVATADHWKNTRDQPTSFPNETWMANRADDIGQRPLKQVVIPGAHDAGTYGMYHNFWIRDGGQFGIAGNFITQNIDFSTQLRVGIRYFDIRAAWEPLQSNENLGHDYFINHSDGYTDLRLKDIFDPIYEWISASEHSKEIIFLQVRAGKHASDASTPSRFQQTCDYFLNKFDKVGNSLLLSATEVSTLFPGRTLPELTMNEIWSISGSRRVIADWSDCAKGSTSSPTIWPAGTFGNYYASQCHPDPYTPLFGADQRPGIIEMIQDAMPLRVNAVERADARFGTSHGFVAHGLYTLSVAPTISGDCALLLDTLAGGQPPVITTLVNAWDNLELKARANLNYVYGDFVQFSNIDLAGKLVPLNKGPKIAATTSAGPAGGSIRVTFTCTPWDKTSNGGPLPPGETNTVSKLAVTGAATGSVANSGTLAVNVPASANGTILAECVETSGAIARMSGDLAAIGRSVWMIGTNALGSYGFGIHHLTASGGWEAVDGAAVRIAAGPDGLPWVINSADQIFRRSATGVWSQLTGSATDLAIGADGSAWVIGANGGPADFGIWHWTGSSWEGVDGAGASIAVGPDGQPWVVNSAGQVYRRRKGATSYVNGSWEKLPGSARDIGVGADGSVWIVEADGGADGSIARWDGSAWRRLAGDARGVRITVDQSGQPWVVNAAGWIFRRQADGIWIRLPGEATDIAVGGGP